MEILRALLLSQKALPDRVEMCIVKYIIALSCCNKAEPTLQQAMFGGAFIHMHISNSCYIDSSTSNDYFQHTWSEQHFKKAVKLRSHAYRQPFQRRCIKNKKKQAVGFRGELILSTLTPLTQPYTVYPRPRLLSELGHIQEIKRKMKDISEYEKIARHNLTSDVTRCQGSAAVQF
jgi:hypothetical protein